MARSIFPRVGTFALVPGLLLAVPSDARQPATPIPASQGLYRLPYAGGTMVEVFDDTESHRPVGRTDLFAVEGRQPYRVVAAAAGRIMAIQDGYREQQSGRATSECRNNYVWIAHPNGEWTNYSHLAHGTVTGRAGLKVGDEVAAGAYLGDEGTVGCSMLNHVHFEVAVPRQNDPVDVGGFLNDNANAARLRRPRFCGVDGETVRKGQRYRAAPCP